MRRKPGRPPKHPRCLTCGAPADDREPLCMVCRDVPARQAVVLWRRILARRAAARKVEAVA